MSNIYKKIALSTIVTLLLLLSALSMNTIRKSSLWYDEILSYMCAGGGHYGPTSLIETLNCVRRIESSPPSYIVVLKAWGTFAGWSEFSVWMLSSFTGLIAVASTYRLGRDLFAELGEQSARVIGISAAVVLGMSAFFIQFLFELRFYIFVVLETIWFVWEYWQIIRQKNPARWLQLAFMLTVPALLYLHYTTLCVLAGVALYHLLFVHKNRAWWRVPLLMAVGSLLFLPWLTALLSAVDQVVNFPSQFRRTPLQMVQIATFAFSNSNVGLLVLLGSFALMAARTNQKGKQAIWFAWTILIMSLLVGLLMIVVLPFVNRPRYLLYLWPLAALLVGLGINELYRRKVNPSIVLMIWTVAGLWNFFNPSPDNMDHNLRLPWRTFQTELHSYAQPNDVVLFHTPTERLFESLEFKHYTFGLPIRGSLTENIPGDRTNDEYFKQVNQFINQAPRLWIGVEQSTVPNFRLAEVQRILKSDYTYCYTAFDYPWLMRLELYARKHLSPTARFGDLVNFVDIALLSPLQLNSDKALPVLLSISHSETLPSDTYSLALHLEDSQGQLKVQHDFGLPSEPEQCHLATISLKGLPTGVYRLRAIIYEWRNGKRLLGQTVDTGTNDERPIIGQITIASE